MTQKHPIIPPPELVQQWLEELYGGPVSVISPFDQRVLIAAAQWGADQELEACLRLVEIDAGEDAYDFARYIRAARRPKPPSLKKEAMDTLHLIRDHLPADMYEKSFLIRRALEQLPDNE